MAWLSNIHIIRILIFVLQPPSAVSRFGISSDCWQEWLLHGCSFIVCTHAYRCTCMFVLDCGFLCTGLILNIIPSALLPECMNALQWDFARKWKKMHMLSLSYTK